MQISITPDQFSTLEEKLSVQQGIALVSTSDTSGTLTTSDVTLSYTYDGSSTMDVEVTAKHSWKAKIAFDKEINSQISQMFQKYLA